MKLFAETRGVGFELTRHFLGRMFDGEWSSERGSWQTVAAGAVALCLPAGMLFVRELSPDPAFAGRYRALSQLPSPEAFQATALADQLALLVLLFALAGLVALLQWQSLFPSRGDYLALAGLPVRPAQVFAARFGAVALFSTGLSLAVILLPSILAPFEFSGRWQKNPSGWVNFGAEAAAAGLECLFVFFAVVATQGVLLNALPGRLFARVSAWVQGGLMGVMLFAGLRCWSIQKWEPADIAKLPQYGGWAPPVWFAGLHEWLLGDRNPFLTAMARRAGVAVLAALAVAGLTYVISYRRYRRLLVEARMEAPARRMRRWSIPDLLSREPRQRALLHFMAATLARSRAHRTVWFAYIGGAVALLLNGALIDGAFLAPGGHGMDHTLKFLVFFWPTAGAAVLLPGFRHVLRIPVELRANWIFRITESEGRKEWIRAVDRFTIAYAIVPIFLVLTPIAVFELGWQLAARVTVLQVLYALALFESLFYSWQQLPFTCSYAPGTRPLVVTLGRYIGALGVLVPIISFFIAAASQFVPMFCIFVLWFGGAWLKARHMRKDGLAEARLIYEDVPNAAPDLGIREMSYRPSAV